MYIASQLHSSICVVYVRVSVCPDGNIKVANKISSYSSTYKYYIPAGQTCPTVQDTTAGNCVDLCSSDDDCRDHKICCSNGCGGRTCSDSVEYCLVK